MLYRVTLALLDLWVRQRKQSPAVGADENSNMQRLLATAQDISDFVKNLNVPPESLLKTAFGVRNMKGGQIKRLQDRNELTVRPTSSSSSLPLLSSCYSSNVHSSLFLLRCARVVVVVVGVSADIPLYLRIQRTMCTCGRTKDR